MQLVLCMIKNEMLDRKYCESKEDTTTNLTSHSNRRPRMLSRGQELLVACDIYLSIVVMVYGTVNHVGVIVLYTVLYREASCL